MTPMGQPPARPTRSRLPRDEARQRYVEIGVQVALERIKADAEALRTGSVVIGPFASLDANAVAARDGKTRGVIANLFGSQSAFQAETMALVLSAQELIEEIEYPRPADYPGADEWVDAFFAEQAARGPSHGAEPRDYYTSLWTLWLSAVPYSVWSDEVAEPGLQESRDWMTRMVAVFEEALDHFDLTLQPGTSLDDLAVATAGLVEGLWLTQCQTARHPIDPKEPIATSMRRSGRLLWNGATRPRADVAT
jgi:hypothetical protein